MKNNILLGNAGIHGHFQGKVKACEQDKGIHKKHPGKKGQAAAQMTGKLMTLIIRGEVPPVYFRSRFEPVPGVA